MSRPVRQPAANVRPRLRVILGREIALGPGKIELLGLVQQTGSISKAARRMKMSYMRAWLLIKTMNQAFKTPLILTARGGQRGGGAELTRTGHNVLRLYQSMEKASTTAIKRDWQALRRLLRH